MTRLNAIVYAIITTGLCLLIVACFILLIGVTTNPHHTGKQLIVDENAPFYIIGVMCMAIVVLVLMLRK